MDELTGLKDYPLARRGFMMTGLISGFTMATAHGALAQRITTDAHGLVTQELQIPAEGGGMPSYMARPDGAGPFPIILVIEEIFGVHEYIKDVCRRFAKQGYLAVAPELYARYGELTDNSTEQQINAIVGQAPDAQIYRDLDTAAAWAGENHGDANRVGVNGFCRGGRVTWLYIAHSHRPKAAVAWYGPLDGGTKPIQPQTPLDVAGEINCPLLGLYGGEDPSSSPAQIARAEAVAKETGKTVEIIVYPDAPHGFHADYRPSYRREDAMGGWKRALAWFKTYDVA
jgi:carboxymethylenebutenolidase